MKHIYSFRVLTLLLLMFSAMTVHAQSTISGSVMDAETQELIPGVNIIVLGSNTGTTTDFDGNFSIEASKGDVLVLSSIVSQ